MAVLLLLISVVSLLLVVFYLHFRWSHRHVLSAAAKLPCPSTLPLVGNALLFLGDINSVTRNLIKFTTEFRGVYCIWAGPLPFFVVSEPSDVQILLNRSSTSEKDYIYEFLKEFGGDGLITASTTMWKKYRKLINPVLHPTNIEKFLPVFNKVSRDLVGSIAVTPGLIEPHDVIFNTAVASVLGTVVKVSNFNETTQGETIPVIRRILHVGGILYSERIFKVWLHNKWIFNLLCRKELQQVMDSKDYCMNLIDQELKYQENARKDTSKVLENDKKSCPKTLFDVSLDNPPDGSDAHMWRDEFTTMIAASTDTSTASLPFLLVTLAIHPDVQSKVEAEINTVLGDTERDVTMADLNSMKYLDQVIMESMRLHGSVPYILRRATNDTKLTACTLPSGSRILVPLQAMGWNTNVFQDPDRFMPERFSPKNQKNRHPYSFIPFSRGPRNCLGKTFALTFMKTVVVHILRKCRISTEVRLEDIEYQLKTVIFSKTPLLIKFETR